MRRLSYWALALSAVVLLTVDHARARAGRPDPPGAGAQIQNEDCAVCHEELAKRFERTPHAALEKGARYAQKNSCETCHGPGQAHVDGDGDTGKVLSFGRGDPRGESARCLPCHVGSREVQGFAMAKHAKSGLGCADCHKVHDAAVTTPLLKSKANTLCMSCHTEQRAEFSKPFHHRVREEAMRCVDCHQPHGGLERRQLRAGTGGATGCVSCHNDKGGPFVFEHAALRIRDCQTCHQPHGSNNAKMLVRSTVRSLCLECHSTSRAGFGTQPPAFHDVRSPRYQNCTTCHARIHGSNASRLLLQ